MLSHFKNQFLRLWRRTTQSPRPRPRRHAPRPTLECLEDRTTPSTLSIASGLVDYSGQNNVSDNLTISHSGSMYTFNDTADTISLGSGTAGFTGNGTHTVTGPASSFHGIELFFGGLFNTVSVQSTAVNTTVNDTASTGSVTINVGNTTNGTQSITGTVADLARNASFVSVNDSADTTGRHVTVSTVGVGGLSSGFIQTSGTNMQVLTINGGSGGNTFTVTGTPANANTNLNTGTGNDTTNVQATGANSSLAIDGQAGTDTVNLGSKAPNFGGTLANIHGDSITVANAAGQTILNVDDSGDATADINVQVNPFNITGLGSGGTTISYHLADIGVLNILGGGGGNVFHVNNTPTSRVTGEPTTTIQTGAGNDTTYVDSVAPKTNLVINGNAGNDIVVLGSKAPGSGSTLGTIAGATVAVENTNRGHTALTIDDTGDTTGQTAALQTVGPVNNPTFEFTIPTYAPGTAAVQVTFAPTQLSSLTVDGGSGNNTCNISDFGKGLPTTINTGNGNDAVNVTVDSTSGYNLTLHGGTGSNSLTINDPSRAATFNPNPAPQNTGTVTTHYLAPGISSTFTYTNMGTVSEKPDANHSFVQALFHDVYGRSGSQAELNAYVNELPELGQAGVAAAINHTPDAYSHVVKGWFQQFLGTAPTPRELAQYTGELAGGATQEHVLSEILATPQFVSQVFARQPNPNVAYVDALAADLLATPANRISAGALQQALGLLHQIGPQGLAYEVLTSTPYRTLQVTADYERLPHRPPSPLEVSDWVNSGLDLLSIQIGIEALPEFFTFGG